MRQTNKRFSLVLYLLPVARVCSPLGNQADTTPPMVVKMMMEAHCPTSTDRGDEGDGGERAIADIADQLEASEHGTDGEGEDSEPFDHRADAELGN